MSEGAEVLDDDPPEWSLREDEGLHHRDCEEREPCLLAEPFDQVHPRVLRLWGGCTQLEIPLSPRDRLLFPELIILAVCPLPVRARLFPSEETHRRSSHVVCIAIQFHDFCCAPTDNNAAAPRL